MTGLKQVALLAALLLAATEHPLAAPVDEHDLALAYGDKSFVSIATGTPQPLTRAPAVASVITAEDIKALGARDLDEVLATVAGLHVSRSPLAWAPLYVMRGLYSEFNQQVLVLVNGIPITNSFLGNRGLLWSGFPVENIARIEVIRGPGSAVYGADAFAGVINVITRSADSVTGTEGGVRGGTGSFESWDAWTQRTGTLGPFKAMFYVRAGEVNDQKETIEADQQTSIDAELGTNASLAPGRPNTGYKAADARIDLATDRWRLRMGYQGVRDAGSGAGIASALDPTGHNDDDRFLTDLTYHHAELADHWDFTYQSSYYYWSERSRLTLFPAGAFGGAFPDGMKGNPDKWERHWRHGVSALFTGLRDHKLRLGTGYIKDDMYKIRESKNFTIVVVPGVGPVPVSLGDVQEATDSNIFMRPHARTVRYAYVQDEWALARDWFLTAGLRHDRYSDFGDTTNPRLALAWEAAYNVTAKLLYGRAFRAPSFTELYSINNPVTTGNPDLKPERIATTEAAVSWQPRHGVQLGLSLFRYHMRDGIRFVSNADSSTGATAQNTGEQTGRGAELETSWDATKSVRLSGNYARQRSIDKPTGQDAGNAPRDRVYLRADWRFLPGWNLTTQATHVANRKRAPDDARAEIADYTLVDLTLGTRHPKENWDVAFSIKNLFDEDAREPSPAPGLIPNDLPLPGRWYLLQMRARF